MGGEREGEREREKGRWEREGGQREKGQSHVTARWGSQRVGAGVGWEL